MKKNMFAVLILIVVIVNLTLNAYLIFTVVPNAQRTDKLITNILQIIDLELQSPLPSDINITYDITKVEKSEFDQMSANLKTGADGKAHFAKINFSLTMNTEDEDYSTLSPSVTKMKSDITQIVIDNVSRYTYEEIIRVEVQANVRKQILSDIQSMFNSRFIVDCTTTFLIS